MRVLKKELWPVKIVIGEEQSNLKIVEIEEWLGSSMGAFKDKWNVVYQYNRTDFYFRNSRDATMFSLRWS